jgi:serine/threonine protein kinase
LSGVQTNIKKDAVPPGTLLWMAPEVIRGEEYTIKSDVFSFGIIIWEIISREEPYPVNPFLS